MSKVEQLKLEIESLSSEDYVHLRQWLMGKDWEKWDQEIENDADSGKLDFLIEEALEEKEKNQLRVWKT